MSSHLHTPFIRASQCAVAVAAGLMIAFAIPAAPAAEHTRSLGPGGAIVASTPLSPRATPPSALHLGASARVLLATMCKLETRGYVQIECLVNGPLMFNPHTHRIEKVFV
jgi:hypothetical protein